MAKRTGDDRRDSPRGRGLVRLEVLALEADRPLLREVARKLRDEPEQAKTLRSRLQGLLELRPPLSRKAVLAAAPLEGIDLTRDGDLGREVEL